MHLLDPQYATLGRAAPAARRPTSSSGPSAKADSAAPWSTWNVTAYRHPLSAGLPFVGRWLDMPQQPLPGDLYTPNMHWNSTASSERMIVSPGHESEGIMHMPTGAERTSALAVLCELTSGVGERRGDAVSAGADGHTTLTLTPVNAPDLARVRSARRDAPRSRVRAESCTGNAAFSGTAATLPARSETQQGIRPIEAPSEPVVDSIGFCQ